MKFCVIGLGRFGYHLATVLAENGMEVLAVDSNESIVASIRNNVTHAICMRVTDEKSLQSINIEEMDTVIVAMGENFSQSILVTALLKKRLKIPNVIARAISDLHKEILNLIGADRIVLPEQEVGIKLADQLSSPFTDVMRLNKNFSISYITAPEKFVGQAIKNIPLYKNYQAYCIGIKHDDVISPVAPEYVVLAGDRLVLAGNTQALESIAHL